MVAMHLKDRVIDLANKPEWWQLMAIVFFPHRRKSGLSHGVGSEIYGFNVFTEWAHGLTNGCVKRWGSILSSIWSSTYLSCQISNTLLQGGADHCRKSIVKNRKCTFALWGRWLVIQKFVGSFFSGFMEVSLCFTLKLSSWKALYSCRSWIAAELPLNSHLRKLCAACHPDWSSFRASMQEARAN